MGCREVGGTHRRDRLREDHELVMGQSVNAVVVGDEIDPVDLHHVRKVQVVVLAMQKADDRALAEGPVQGVEPRSQEQFRGGPPAGDDDPTVVRKSRSRERACGDALQAVGDGAMEDFPRRCEGDGAVAALEQPDPESAFQLGDGAADGRLRGAEFRRGGAEAQVPRGALEYARARIGGNGSWYGVGISGLASILRDIGISQIVTLPIQLQSIPVAVKLIEKD